MKKNISRNIIQAEVLVSLLPF